MALEFADVGSIVKTSVRKEIIMNWKNSSVAYLKMTKERKRPDMTAYSDFVKVPVYYQRTGGATWYDKGDSLTAPLTPQITAAKYPYKFAAVQCAVAGPDLIKTSGPDAVHNIKEALVKNCLEDLMELISGTSGLFSDGTNTKAMVGLRSLIADATYGGIATADMADWAAKTFTASSTMTLENLDRFWSLSWDGGDDRPDLGLTRPSVFSKLRSLLLAQERYTPTADEEERKAGFIGLMFNGTPIYADTHVPGSDYGSTDNHFYLLQLKYLDIFIHPDRNFKVDEPIRPANEDTRIWPILVAMNLLCSRRNRQSRWATINPSL